MTGLAPVGKDTPVTMKETEKAAQAAAEELLAAPVSAEAVGRTLANADQAGMPLDSRMSRSISSQNPYRSGRCAKLDDHPRCMKGDAVAMARVMGNVAMKLSVEWFLRTVR